ncbi:MAG: hypothetical protein ACFFDY_08725 [Candidatus Thorarchaeota archaeon]
MKYEKVLKFLKIMGSIFILISLVEIVFIILMNFVFFTIDGSSYLLNEIIYSSTMFQFAGTLLWIFLISAMVCYAIIGLFMFKTGSKTDIESIPLAKFLVVIGMVVLLAGFVKMNYLVNLGKTRITSTVTTVTFQTALYDMNITPIMPGIFWVFFISANIAILISGLVITAVGIKYTLLQEQEANK